MLLEDRDVMAQAAKVETLLEDIESLPDPHVRAMAADVVQALLVLHGEGLGRILRMLTRLDDTESGARIIRAMTEDELVSHLLFLHDLHPVPVEMRVADALERLEPQLKALGGAAELIAVEQSAAHVRLSLHRKSCPSTAMAQRRSLEEAIQKAAPELIDIVTEVVREQAPAAANFIPISALQSLAK